ncbi:MULTISPECIES: hypothetical protein [unclassified Pseudomonas]|uniref:hypothetical protein n=1 Tax=unclassified Pseudomonas TaxID=196821 RepID=UPI001C42FF77|nr:MULTISPECIES: hypothetical protein [unclassified Pseudomonas]
MAALFFSSVFYKNCKGAIMNFGAVRFKVSCLKTLTAVEADPDRSNQHEFNGVKELKYLFGEKRFSAAATFSVRGSATSCETSITWYDAREAHPSRTEHRLYFKTNIVMEQAEEGDNIVVGYDTNDRLNFVLLKKQAPDHVVHNSWARL